MAFIKDVAEFARLGAKALIGKGVKKKVKPLPKKKKPIAKRVLSAQEQARRHPFSAKAAGGVIVARKKRQEKLLK